MEGDIFETLNKYNQNHLAEHYKSLNDPKKKEEFLKQLKSIDYAQAQQLYQHVYVERQAVQGQDKLNFAPVSNITTHEDLKVHAKEFEDIGFEAIARGEGNQYGI